MFPLHKVPRGLLELFRLQVLGSNPTEFGSSVQPVTDVSEFYATANKLLSGASAATGALTGGGIGSTLTLTGNMRMHHVGCRLTVGAAAATNVTLSVHLIATGAILPLYGEFFAAVNAGATIGIGGPLPTRPIIPPGRGFAFIARASGTAAGTDHVVQVMSLIDNITSQAP